MNITETELKNTLETKQFAKTLSGYFDLFYRRYKHYEYLVENRKDPDEIWAYSDLLIVHLRALIIENESLRNNYTLQNYFTSIGREDLKNELNQYLLSPLYDEWDLTLKDFIKIQADEFICHNDNVERKNKKTDRALESYFSVYLRDFNNDYCMKNIVNKLCKLVYNATMNQEILHGDFR